MKVIYKFALLIFSIVMLIACGDDDKPSPNVEPEPTPAPISEFIWDGLNQYYLWEAEVAPLQLSRGSNEWKAHLNGYGQRYEDLFESLLNRKLDAKGNAGVDRWSWFIYDWREQDKAFEGISKSFGYEYLLSKYSDNDGVYGYVTYVLPNSPASAAGVKRGDVFVSVNGKELTVSNYRDLLFGNDSYELGLAEVEEDEKGGTIITPNGKKISITAVANFKENPILLAKTIDVPGKKVGYLVYNGFTGTDEFNLALNDSIGKLKNEGATELVLDLRYNGGGSTYSAQILASMIDGNHTGKLFNKTHWNDKMQSYIIKKWGEGYLEDNFVNKIVDKDGKTIAMINSLGLNRIFILTSEGTASSSELIINGLKPYIDVVLIGTTTHGKYTFSITVKDWLESGEVNPDHFYAMQPIVGKSANANGISDYGDGFAPDYKRNEWDYLAKIKPLGDPEEPYLKTALDVISGNNPPKEEKAATRSGEELETLFDSKIMKPLYREMYNDRINLNLKN